MDTNNELFYAYLAGFIDADGSISISTVAHNKNQVVALAAHNCKYAPIELLHNMFGGKVRLKKTGKCRNEINWRPCYEWKLTANKAIAVIKKLLPYLMIKKTQAILAIRLQRLKNKYRGKRQWDSKIDAKCERVYSRIKAKCVALNKRGI